MINSATKLLARGGLFIILLFLASDGFSQRYRGVGVKDDGFGIIVEGGFYKPFEVFDAGFGVQANAGIHATPNVFIGGALGVDAYQQEIFVPIMANGRYYFLNEPFSVYASFDLGYSLKTDDLSQSGVVYGPAVGIRQFFSHDFALIGSLGYRGLYQTDRTNPISGSSALGTFMIRAGFSF